MPKDPRFDAPRTLARALAELARRHGSARAREAELRAVLPAVLGPWLHARVADVRLTDASCVIVMSDSSSAREIESHSQEVHRELSRRLGWAPPRLRAAALPPAPEAPRRTAASAPAEAMPMTAQALREVPDPDLRRRLARWAGIALDEP